MTNEEINRAIAEACGREPVCHCGDTIGSHHLGGNEHTFTEMEGEPMPDYCEDLNAMHEAEKVLPIGNQINGTVAYGNKLMRLCGTHEACIRATAAQRAEAFLRTIGKWREDEHPIADPPKVCDTPKQEEPK